MFTLSTYLKQGLNMFLIPQVSVNFGIKSFFETLY